MTTPQPGFPMHLVAPPTGPHVLGGWWTASRAASELRRVSGMVQAVIEQLTERAIVGPDEQWVPSAPEWTSTGTGVFRLGPVGGEAVALLRLAPTGKQRLHCESAALDDLCAAPLDAAIRAILPKRLAAGRVQGCPYVLDALLPGVSALSLVGSSDWPAVQSAALTAADSLHRATATRRTCDEALLRRWVHAPLTVLEDGLRRLPGARPTHRLEQVRTQLVDALSGRAVQVSWVHGDFWSGNLLVDGTSHRLTGVIDWDLASSPELPIHDYLHLLLYTRRTTEGVDLGSVVSGLLRGRTSWTAPEKAALSGADWCFPEGTPPLRLQLLLHWLRYAAAVSIRQRSYVTHSVRMWELQNVHRVLRAL